MEIAKQMQDGFDDSYAENSAFSSDSSNNDASDVLEEIKWENGDKLKDPSFSNNCIQNFSKSEEIIQLPEDKRSTPLKCFYLFFPDSILELIVAESKKYFELKEANGFIKKSEKKNSTYKLYKKDGLAKSDILLYFGANIFMGINKKPEIKLHWNTGSYFSSKYLKKYITKGKYMMIKEIFHLADNQAHKGEHPFYKISEFMKNLSALFRKYFAPSQNLTIDESMASYKGRSEFKF